MLSIFIWNYIQIEKERCSRVSADQMGRIDQLGGREQESKQETAKEEREGGGAEGQRWWNRKARTPFCKHRHIIRTGTEANIHKIINIHRTIQMNQTKTITISSQHSKPLLLCGMVFVWTEMATRKAPLQNYIIISVGFRHFGHRSTFEQSIIVQTIET